MPDNPTSTPDEKNPLRPARRPLFTVANVLLAGLAIPACLIAFTVTCSIVSPGIIIGHAGPNYYTPGRIAGVVAAVIVFLLICLFAFLIHKRPYKN